MKRLSVEGKIANHDREFDGRIEIDLTSGLIENVSPVTGSADILAKGIIFPGFVDLHIHAREDASGRMNYKEDYITCSQAAINGGVVAFADMPNTPTAPVNDEIYEEKKEIAKKSLVDATVYAAIGPGTEPLSFRVPYKVYMGPSVGNLYFASQWELEEVIKKYKGKHISFHCESPEVMQKYKDEPTHERQRPPGAESTAVEFALELIQKYDLRGKICHTSSRETVEKIMAAKKSGVAVTSEVTLHHLFFDEGMLTRENRIWLEVNPPLRSARDRTELIHALKLGEIDYLVTDHAPHTKEDKEKHVSGMPGLDTYGSFAAWLMKEQGFSARDIAMVCAYNPGKFVNQFSPSPNPSHQGRGKEEFPPLDGEGKGGVNRGFGCIAKGYVGSLTIIDPNQPIKISKFNIKTKCGWSPYEGITFPGRVTHTIIRGKVYEHK